MTTFTKTLAAINLLGAGISLALFVTTFFAQGLIIHKARQYALSKTEAYMAPAIFEVENMLENPFVAKTLPVSVKEKVGTEIASYHESPTQWLLEIAGGAHSRDFDFPEIKNPLARKGLDFLTKRLSGARDHFKRSFANLITDLRIFTAIHTTVFLAAASLCFIAKTPMWRFWLGIWSSVLLITTLMSAGLYLGQNWLWVILTNRYQGWGYAGSHLLITLYCACKILPEIQLHSRENSVKPPP